MDDSTSDEKSTAKDGEHQDILEDKSTIEASPEDDIDEYHANQDTLWTQMSEESSLNAEAEAEYEDRYAAEGRAYDVEQRK